MGIRLNKKLGWALTGLEHDDRGCLTDPRINKYPLERYDQDGAVGGHYLAYLEAARDAERCEGDDDQQSEAWFDLSMSLAMATAAREQHGTLGWPITYQSDTGRPDLLLIQPVGYPEWSRYDDPIDHQEEAALHPGMEPRVVPMPQGIYPFTGMYMDSRNGQKVDSTARRLIDRLLDHKNESEEVQHERRRAAEHLAHSLGFDGAEQARQHIVPTVPADVRHVISWLNLFNGPDVWLQLRPVLYVYWS